MAFYNASIYQTYWDSDLYFIVLYGGNLLLQSVQCVHNINTNLHTRAPQNTSLFQQQSYTVTVIWLVTSYILFVCLVSTS